MFVRGSELFFFQEAFQHDIALVTATPACIDILFFMESGWVVENQDLIEESIFDELLRKTLLRTSFIALILLFLQTRFAPGRWRCIVFFGVSQLTLEALFCMHPIHPIQLKAPHHFVFIIFSFRANTKCGFCFLGKGNVLLLVCVVTGHQEKFFFYLSFLALIFHGPRLSTESAYICIETRKTTHKAQKEQRKMFYSVFLSVEIRTSRTKYHQE